MKKRTLPPAAPSEVYVNVPLKPEIKSALTQCAALNSRAAGREAAVIITKSVMRSIHLQPLHHPCTNGSPTTATPFRAEG